jgi:hypothetical protein
MQINETFCSVERHVSWAVNAVHQNVLDCNYIERVLIERVLPAVCTAMYVHEGRDPTILANSLVDRAVSGSGGMILELASSRYLDDP